MEDPDHANLDRFLTALSASDVSADYLTRALALAPGDGQVERLVGYTGWTTSALLRDIRERVAANPQASPADLARLAAMTEADLLALSPAPPPGDYHGDWGADMRIELDTRIASNPATPTDVLEMFWGTDKTYLHHALAMNPALPVEFYARLNSHRDSTRRKWAGEGVARRICALGVHPDNAEAIASLSRERWWLYDSASQELALTLSIYPNPPRA